MIYLWCHSNNGAQKRSTILHLLGYSITRGQLEKEKGDDLYNLYAYHIKTLQSVWLLNTYYSH